MQKWLVSPWFRVMVWRYLPVMAIIALYASGMGTVRTLHAQSATPQCNELQVIFVVDQSGSMFGTRELAPSDPDAFREYGVAQGIEILSNLRYQSYPDALIRVAAIDFGDTVALRLPWTTLDPENSESSRLILSEIMTLRGTRTESMGNTNFVAAMQGAASLFSQVREPQAGCPNRAVVLITDGKPAGPTVINEEQHFAQITTYIDRYMSPDDHALFVLALDEGNRYWRDVEGAWVRLVGSPARAQRVADAPEMTSRMLQIVRTVTDSLVVSGASVEPLCLENVNVVVPPFVQQLRFTLVKNDRMRDTLSVYDPSGDEVDVQRGDLDVRIEGENEPIQTISVQSPQPGLWRVESTLPVLSLKNCQIQLLSFKATPEVTDSAGSSIALFGEHEITVRIVDSEGSELPQYEDKRYAPVVELELLENTGKTSIIPLVQQPDTYQFLGRIVPVTAGPATLRIRGTVASPDGNPVIIFDRNVATYEVVAPEIELRAPSGDSVRQYAKTLFEFVPSIDGTAVTLDENVVVSGVATTNGTDTDLPIRRQADGSYQAEFSSAVAGPSDITFTVSHPAGVIAERTFPIEVVPTERLDIRLIPPPEGGYVATDWMLQPTGLPLLFEVVGENNQPLSFAQIGIADLRTAFSIDITPPDAGQPVRALQLRQTGSARQFALQPNTLGIGCHAVVVTPVSLPGEAFVWRQDRWSFNEVCGTINWRDMGIPALAAIAAVIAVAGTAMVLRGRPRASTGQQSVQLVIIRQDPDPRDPHRRIDTSVRTISVEQVPQEIVMSSGVRGFFERWASLPGQPPEPTMLRKLVVTASDDRQTTVEVFYRGRPAERKVLDVKGVREASLHDNYRLKRQ
jgi:hypothetical protein